MPSMFEEIAQRLGLTYGVKPGLVPVAFAAGLLEGQPVRCSWSDRATRVEATFEPPLDLGLHIRSRAVVGLPVFGRRLFLDDSNWDDEVLAAADDPARAAVLFAADPRGAVLRLNATTNDLEVTDERVVCHVQLADTASVIQALTHVARVAALFATARRSLPLPYALRMHAEALRTFAGEHHLDLHESPLHLRGELRAVHLAAGYGRSGRNTFDLTLRADPLEIPPSFGLALRRESTLDRVRTFFGGQDVRTGDAAFDPTYLVRADDPERAVLALDSDVRALLLDLAARFDDVAVEGATVTARTPSSRVLAADLIMLLEAACTVSEHVARAATAVSRGPYR